MTYGDRYQQYSMEAENGAVHFYRRSKTERGAVMHNLSEMHISTTDTQDKKVLDESRRLFGIILWSKSGHRKIYFLSHALMITGLEYLVS